MRVIDPSARQKESPKPAILGRLQTTLNNLSGPGDAPAQESLIAVLQRSLDNQYLLLRNIVLSGLEEPVPLLLAGPTGLWAIHASPLRGLYRAKDEAWEKLEGHSQHFRPARPNLLSHTRMLATALGKHLSASNFDIPEIEPVLYFSDPGIHIDTTRPVVRIVPPDAVDRFVAGVLQAPVVLNPETIQRIANLLAGEQTPPESAPRALKDDIFTLRDLPPEPVEKQVRKVVVKREAKKVSFSPGQWLFLGAMVVFNLIILAAFVVYILATT